MKYDLSILIPARNEMFLSRTVDDILANIEGNTEIIIVLDGEWANPPVKDNPRVTIIYHPESVGQRAATNEAAKLSSAKYLMKVDAHCSFDKGFDVKLMADMKDDWTMAPTLRNLHAFNWICPDGHFRYQSPSGPCLEPGCGKETTRDMVWIPRKGTHNSSFCFDSEPHFQYFKEFSQRPEGQGDIVPSMSLQGSCFVITREKYWSLKICDEENFPSWGSQGIEVACKTWLSGGQVMVNRKTWYAHLFRTQGGDFGFPYPQSGRGTENAKKKAKELFFEGKWEGAIHPLSWLIEKFWPIPPHGDKNPGWTQKDLDQLKAIEANKVPVPEVTHVTTQNVGPTKGMIFYTDNQLNLHVAHQVQRQLGRVSKETGIPIVSCSLKPMTFGTNIHLPLVRGYLTMFKQILAALEASTADIIYFCEHDVLYPKEYFNFTPEKKDTYYYNVNWWRIRLSDGYAVSWEASQVSGLCGYRELLLEHYRKRVAIVEKYGYNHSMGFEPGSHNTIESIKDRDSSKIPADIYIDDICSEEWKSELPQVDIKHGHNLSGDKWTLTDFRDKRTAKNFQIGVCPEWAKDIVSKMK